jgi:dTDP-4-amino-4,6-dideoxygalactose transaminase
VNEFLPAAKPGIGIEEEAVARVLRSGNLAQGEEIAVNGVDHCVAVNSCTAALYLMLLAAGIGASDEVLVPCLTFASTANAVAVTGATPYSSTFIVTLLTCQRLRPRLKLLPARAL